MGKGSNRKLELRLFLGGLSSSSYLFVENATCGSVWITMWKSNTLVIMPCVRATHHNASVHVLPKQSIHPEALGLHPEVLSQICERFGKVFTNANSAYYSLRFFLHGDPNCLNVYAVQHSTMDGISLGLTNLLQSFWKDQGDFVQEGSRKRWLYRIHNVMYLNNTPMNVGGMYVFGGGHKIADNNANRQGLTIF